MTIAAVTNAAIITSSISIIEKGFFVYALSLSPKDCLFIGTIFDTSTSGCNSGSCPMTIASVIYTSPYFAFLRMSDTSSVMMRMKTNSTAAVAMSAPLCSPSA